MTKLFLEPIKDSRKIQSRVANETQRKSEHHNVPGNELKQTHNTEDTSNTSMSTVTLYMLNFSVWSLVYTVQTCLWRPCQRLGAERIEVLY